MSRRFVMLIVPFATVTVADWRYMIRSKRWSVRGVDFGVSVYAHPVRWFGFHWIKA